MSTIDYFIDTSKIVFRMLMFINHAIKVDIIDVFLSGVVASILAILIFEWYKQPDLSIDILEKADGKAFDAQLVNTIHRAFYKLRIVNLGSIAAHNCKISITFFDYNIEVGQELFPSISGKWDFGPEPLLQIPTYTLSGNGQIQRRVENIAQGFLVPFSEVIDIYPNNSETFCILIKYNNEAKCWAFSAWRYLNSNDFRVPRWEIKQKSFVAEVKIYFSGSKSTTSRFLFDVMGTSHGDLNILKMESNFSTKFNIKIRRTIRKIINSLFDRVP